MCAASPISATLPCTHRSLLTSANRFHGSTGASPERFSGTAWCSSGSPHRCRANTCSRVRTVSSGDIRSSPRPCHVCGAHSTMNVLVSASKRYAWNQIQPASVRSKPNVKASNRRDVPSQR